MNGESLDMCMCYIGFCVTSRPRQGSPVFIFEGGTEAGGGPWPRIYTMLAPRSALASVDRNKRSADLPNCRAV